MMMENPLLFKSLMPFGGEIDQDNQLIRLNEHTPWAALSEIHDRHFNVKRRGKKKANQLILGLLIGKTIRGLSDEGILEYFYENPYFQYYCGMDQFITPKMKKVVHPSLLSKRRHKLGEHCFAEFEQEIQKLLVNHKLIKPDLVMLDATVFPSNIEYPNDVKLMNVVREWACKTILEIKNKLNPKTKIRTYARKAKSVYLNFQKKKKKSVKTIKKAKKQMFQYLNRNIRQLEELLFDFGNQAKDAINFWTEIANVSLIKEVENRLKTAHLILKQQSEMITKNTKSIKDRIVSFHQPYVRPIVRGKERAPAEFGPKAHLAVVNGFVFLDRIAFCAFSEQKELSVSISKHRDRFGQLPKTILIDDGYSSRENRDLMEHHSIEHSLKLIGRPTQDTKTRYRKTKLRKKRSEVEGIIGNLKAFWNMDKIRYLGEDGAAIQAYLTFGCHNLLKATKRLA